MQGEYPIGSNLVFSVLLEDIRADLDRVEFEPLTFGLLDNPLYFLRCSGKISSFLLSLIARLNFVIKSKQVTVV